VGKLLLLLVTIVLIGCQTAQVAQVDCGERSPASDVCIDVFSKWTQPTLPARVPTEIEIKSFFDQLTDYSARPWDVIAEVEKAFTMNLGDSKRPVYFGEILARRRREKDFTANFLVSRFGYREHAGYVMPPRNYSKLLSRIYTQVFESARANGVPESQIILPAFVFSRTVRGKKEYAFLRPGIDPLPPKEFGWRLEKESYETPGPVFIDMITNGKMPLTPGMLFHDIGHFIDFIETPKYMPAFRGFLLAKKRFQAEFERPGITERQNSYGKIVNRDFIDRYLNEWVFLPSKRNAEVIDRTLLSRNKSETLAEIEQKYSALTPEQAISKTKIVLRNWNLLFSRHGGGARDMSVERRFRQQDLVEGIIELSTGISNYVQQGAGRGATMDANYWKNEAPHMRHRLEVFLKILEGQEVPPEVQAVVQDGASNLLVKQLAEIEFRIRTAQDLQMSPERMASDLALLYQPEGWKQYRRTPTYRYFSTFRDQSTQWYLAVDVAAPLDLPSQ
jgi:hypothetical protein